MNNFEKYLLEFKEQVDNFKGKKLLEKKVLQRLELSYELYRKSIDELYGYTLSKDPYKQIKKLNNL